jgi:uroporphyrinogen-III synthase
MHRILVLRSGGVDLPLGAAAPDVTLLTTHEVVPVAAGIAEALAFDARGARLVVSSRVTVEILGSDFFEGEFIQAIAVGEETARELQRAGLRNVVIPSTPGATGALHLLRKSPGGLSGLRILWPRGSDADLAPVEELRGLGASVVAPVVYEKRPRSLAALSREEGSVLSDFRSGGFGAVAAGSMAALEALLSWLGNPAPAALPPVRWGVLGPETARAVSARGLPSPAVPARARFVDLIDLLRKELQENA